MAVLVKSLNGLAYASVKNRNGLAVASIKNINGLDTTSGFNPQTQGTLVNWYDASTLGLANGAAVTTWTDSKTGNPNPLTSVNNPPYATPQQNGLGTVSFNGSSQYFPTGGSNASTYPYTIAAVVKIPNTTAAYTILGSSNTGGLTFRTDITTGNLTFVLGNGGTVIGTSTTALGTAAYHLVVGTITSSAYAFEIDGVAAGSGAHAVALTSARTFRVGVDVGSRPFSSHIGEVQIYSSVLSSGDLSGLHTYIVNKWATP